MKRADLIRHLENCGCEFLREGSRHTVYVNRKGKRGEGEIGIGVVVTEEDDGKS